MPHDFRIYIPGQVHFRDTRVTTPVCFAHITDLHLPPVDRTRWPDLYAHAIDWWDREFEHPHQRLPHLLDDAKDHGVDFVFMGGDNVDVYDAETADHIIQLCKQRDLTCYFSFGNHDFESYEIRYVTHDNVPAVRDENGKRLMAHWSMPDRYYSFEVGPVRFIVLDAVYHFVEGGLAGFYDAAQADWLDRQLQHDGPIIVFYHIPFRTSSNQDRLRLVWNGVHGWAAENEDGKRILDAIDGCPNVLGGFAGHTHVRSEDLLGRKWQFVTAAGNQGAWRYVQISNAAPPKSLRSSGRPAVEGDGGSSPVES